MRTALATILMRLACRLLRSKGRVVVVVNTFRKPNIKGPRRGAIDPFITVEPGVAAGFPRGEVPASLGTPVPAALARCAGFEVEWL